MKKTILATTLLLLILAACTSTPPVTPDSINTPTAPSESTSQTPPAQTGPALSDAFKTFMSQRATLEYQAAYDVTIDTQGQHMTAQMNDFVKGSTNMRTDITLLGLETRMYISGGKITSCINQGKWTCTTITQNSDQLAQFEKDYNNDPEKYEVTPDGSKTVAGANTECFKLIQDGATIKYCFSREGAPLYLMMTSPQASTERTAKSYSLSVPASAFDLPVSASTTSAPSGTPSASSSGSYPCSSCDSAPAQTKAACLQYCQK